MTESNLLTETIFQCTYFTGMFMYVYSLTLCASLYTQKQTQQVSWHFPGQDVGTLVSCIHFSGTPILGWVTSGEFNNHRIFGTSKMCKDWPLLSIVFPDLCGQYLIQESWKYMQNCIYFSPEISHKVNYIHIYLHTHTATSLCASQ